MQNFGKYNGSAPLSRSGRHPACRKAVASRPADKTQQILQPLSNILNCTQLSAIFPGGGTPALYGRQDARRYRLGWCAESLWVSSPEFSKGIECK